MAEKEKINPVTLDIVKDSLIAVSNEIFYAFAQTSMSPIIYETLDYASGIADAEGRLLTQGNGVTGFIGMISPMICAVVEKHGKENLHPGDVYIINDPFMGGGTHMSDVGMVMPIFYHDELIAFAGNKAHWSDIGGMAPGSFTTDATNLYQEGMCFSGTKLVDRGELVEPVWDLMRSINENVNNINQSHLHFGMQLIFDESQKDSNNEIWVSCYELVKFLNLNRCEAQSRPPPNGGGLLFFCVTATFSS